MIVLDPVPAAAEVVRSLRSQASTVVLIDGRSGAGKSAFADAVVASTGAQLLRLEDVYPAWDGLGAAAGLVASALRLRRAGCPAVLPSWDWSVERPGPPILVPPAAPLVVEGCGALTRATAPLADLRIWLELPDDERQRRALARDGDVFAPHWERWARQERRIIAREDPRRLADLTVDGSRSRRSAGAQ